MPRTDSNTTNRAEARIADALSERLGTYIKGAEQALMAEKARVLKPLGLTVPQYAALHALSIGPLSGAQLARACSVTPQSITSMLATLEGKELIVRTQSDLHAQVLVTELTASGRKMFARADSAARAVERDLSATFDQDEERMLRALLQRAIDSLKGRAAT
nr:MarR family transcriptional regulator [Rhodococcus sp. (in: high G+C Gram-positive bacteria)]